ncbi:DNA adenine methylase [Clostridium tyrobutyricum]|uniref:DNA adenine methylase n=1 Tax=Clostridium tyrobutyricum TaxID=1519 RepID=UPI00073D8807|nr:DNA adenine methylase [Clostridium tyrobutyricum]
MATPHLVQYQGSKRNIASEILSYFPKKINRLIEPFCGTAAVSILAAQQNKVEKFILNDINKPLVEMLELCIKQPEVLYRQYEEIWNGQFVEGTNNIDYFYKMREKFNEKSEPALMLFMLARVVKGAVRYNNNGQMNQSCDKRRNGTRPELIRNNAIQISNLLNNRTEVYNLDYREIVLKAQPEDLVYMDPPYQGTSNTSDNRYYQGVDYEEFVNALKLLNDKNVDFIISYDGMTGEKKHGKDLPDYLELTHIFINAGKSAQSTLLGKKEITYESLYLSKNLKCVYENRAEQLKLII